MISPFSGDGSMAGQGPGATLPQAGEWIELYNPDLCQSVDISCYFLGNNTRENDDVGFQYYGAAFELPEGTVVPPRGFCIVRGINALPVPQSHLVQNGGNTVEVVIDLGPAVCLGGGFRLWFPNAGGWFAFYDRDGIPQDAISWADVPSTNNPPCNPPGGCPFMGNLVPYYQIPLSHKNYISSNDPIVSYSFARQPDGGNWAVDQTFNPTYGTSNGIPIPAPVITCNGKAMVSVSGGVPPYAYLWDDGQNQSSDTAVGLCEGVYCVTVTDAAGNSDQACIEVKNFSPVVSLGLFDTTCESRPPILLNQGLPAGGVYAGNGVIGNTFDPALAGAGTHVISYTWYNADSCFQSDSSQIVVLPGIFLVMPPPLDVCYNAPDFPLSGASPPGGVFSGPGVQNGVFSPLLAGLGTGIVTYHIESSAYCTALGTMQVTVHAPPEVGLPPFPELCLNTEQFALTTGTPAGGVWSGPGVSGALFSPPATGVGMFPIRYTFTDDHQCTSDTVMMITVNPLPEIHVSANPSVICEGESSLITATGALTYQWSPESSQATSLEVSPMQTTLYKVSGLDEKGCMDSDSCTITVIPTPDANLPDALWIMTGESVTLCCHAGSLQYLWSTGETSAGISDNFCVGRDTIEVVEIPTIFMPNAFSPNGDDLNDYFGPQSDEITRINFWIFSRWGDLAFESNDIRQHWDGNVQGKPASCDVYTWVLEWDYTYVTFHDIPMTLRGKKQGTVLLLR
jgi:gliding motility-associated-like protein